MKPANFVRPFACLAVLAVTASFVVAHFEITTDINHFLPDAGDDRLATLSREIADSELSRTMILTLTAEDLDGALQASRSFEKELLSEPRVANAITFLEGGPHEEVEQSLYEMFAARRLSFLGFDPDGARRRLRDDELDEAARNLREELRGPLSPLISRVAAADPLLVIPGLVRRLQESRSGNLTVADGRFVSPDGRTAVLFLGTRASALDARSQQPLLEGIEAAFERTASRLRKPVRLDQSGINRYATRAATAIESDIKRVSLVSSLLLCVVLLSIFRSLRFVLVASVPVVTGLLAGCAAVLALFGQIHGITVAFGAALISVSIDYVVHLYCHHAIVRPRGGASASLRILFPSLATGALTTLAGFAALYASSLNGLRELACFSVVGIAAAFTVTVFVVPSLLPAHVGDVGARRSLVDWIGRAIGALSSHRTGSMGILVAASIFALGALPFAHFNPDLASLGSMDAEIRAEDERVRSKITRYEQMRFVVALGDTEEAALEVNDVVADRLRAAELEGEIGAHRNLAWILPSPSRQKEIARVATDDATLADRLRERFQAAGFSGGAFDEFFATLDAPLPPPLRFAHLEASDLGSLVRPFRVSAGDRVAFLTFVSDVREPEAIETRLADLPDAIFLRQADLMVEAQLRYQQDTVRLLGLGVAIVLLLLVLRYRDPRRVFAALAPTVLAVGVTVATLTMLGRGLDLISLTALLFVVSMGVDYSVFLVDAYGEENSEDLSSALTGAVLACGSTFIGFGLLGLSDHPVLSNLGITASVGVLTSLLLAPTALILARPTRRR